MPTVPRGFAASVFPTRTPTAESIHEPSARDDEERRQEEAEQCVQPDQRDVEQAKADADPKRSQRTMSFQTSAPEKLTERRKYSDAGTLLPGARTITERARRGLSFTP